VKRCLDLPAETKQKPGTPQDDETSLQHQPAEADTRALRGLTGQEKRRDHDCLRGDQEDSPDVRVDQRRAREEVEDDR
jgi:hypothetical protein